MSVSTFSVRKNWPCAQTRLASSRKAMRRVCRLHRRFNRIARQQLHHKLPQQNGGARVPRKNLGQENRKGLAASAPPPAIRTKHPLPPLGLLAVLIQILPVKKAVAVQRLRTTAAGAALLLERKSSLRSCFRSRTKRNLDFAISQWMPQPKPAVEIFFTVPSYGGTRFRKG